MPRKKQIWVLAGAALFAVYWYLVMEVTGASPANFIIIRDFAQSANLSLIPFRDLADVLGSGDVRNIVRQIGGNVLMFMPLGFLVPVFWPGWRKLRRTACLGFGLSLFIECSQLFNYRASTTDDLILNTLGAVLGYGCYWVVARLFEPLRRGDAKRQGTPVWIALAVWLLCTVKESWFFLTYTDRGAAVVKPMLMHGYALAAALLPFLAAYAVLYGAGRRRGRKPPAARIVLMLLFALYLAEAFHVTGAGTLYNLQMYGASDLRQINLIPFSQEIDWVGYAQNVLLFLPFGLLAPLLWRGLQRWQYTACAGLSVSLLIELSQLCNNRRTDVDDLILNTVGAVLGYLLFRLLARCTKWTDRLGEGLPYEPAVLIAGMFVGRFLLFNEFGLARILYTF